MDSESNTEDAKYDDLDLIDEDSEKIIIVDMKMQISQKSFSNFHKQLSNEVEGKTVATFKASCH